LIQDIAGCVKIDLPIKHHLEASLLVQSCEFSQPSSSVFYGMKAFAEGTDTVINVWILALHRKHIVHVQNGQIRLPHGIECDR
jgi:hypothetical protein